MHPIFQWLDYSYQDYGGFGRGDRRPLHRRLPQPLRRRRQYPQRHASTTSNSSTSGGSQGRAAVVLDRPLEEHLRSMSRTRFYFLPNVAAVAGTQFLLRHPRSAGSLPRRTAMQSGADRVQICGARKPACCGTSIRRWQVFGNISRSAEVPSFGESVGRASGATCPIPVHRHPGRRAPRPMRSARADEAARLYLGSRGLSRRISATSCNASTAPSAIATSPTPTGPFTRASKPAPAPRSSEGIVRQRPDAGQALAQSRLHVQRLPFRQRSDLRQQSAARRAAPLSPRRAALQASERLLFRTQCRMGAAGLFRRQRQHAEDRGLCAAGA